jgi:ERCC4-related helicase
MPDYEFRLTAPFDPREYQATIAQKAAQQNTLVVLPTGMGKTLVAVLVGIERLKADPTSKIMIMAPTRPLNAQHTQSFEKLTNVPKEDIVLITGKLTPDKRAKVYKCATVVAATPQCIENDLASGLLNLSDFSFVIFDEAHRAVKNYSYTTIAKKYMMQARSPLILGLTASPGASREKIEQITDNLFIKAVEIRSEVDEDVAQYVQKTEQDWVYVDFPEQYKKIKELLSGILADDVNWLKDKHYIPIYKPSKKMLLDAQRRIAASYSRSHQNFGALWALIRSAEAIKVEHAIELLETQGIDFLYEYLTKIKASQKRTDKRLSKNRATEEVMGLLEGLLEGGEEHPKMRKLREMVVELAKKPDVKMIIFANYRATVERIRQMVEKEGISAHEFIGQQTKDDGGKERTGMKQEEQIEMLNRFRAGEFKVLVATSVGEEGLDVPSVDYAIFYEPVASEIRMIQRRGRTGRQAAGKVIFMITKGTRDEAYFYASLRKERRMKGILYEMKEGKPIRKKRNLLDFAKP